MCTLHLCSCPFAHQAISSLSNPLNVAAAISGLAAVADYKPKRRSSDLFTRQTPNCLCLCLSSKHCLAFLCVKSFSKKFTVQSGAPHSSRTTMAPEWLPAYPEGEQVTACTSSEEGDLCKHIISHR